MSTTGEQAKRLHKRDKQCQMKQKRQKTKTYKQTGRQSWMWERRAVLRREEMTGLEFKQTRMKKLLKVDISHTIFVNIIHMSLKINQHL